MIIFFLINTILLIAKLIAKLSTKLNIKPNNKLVGLK